jgi:hypothetical protein
VCHGNFRYQTQPFSKYFASVLNCLLTRCKLGRQCKPVTNQKEGNRIIKDNIFLKGLLLSDEATFHLSGHINYHNIRVWGSEQPRIVREHERHSPKVDVWCGLMHDRIIGPFFFFFCRRASDCECIIRCVGTICDTSASGTASKHVPKRWGPPHWCLLVRQCLDRHFSGCWIGRGEPLARPPQSPDLSSLDFLFGSMWKTLFC